MKKYIFTTLILVIALSLAACTETPAPNNDTSVEENQSNVVEEDNEPDEILDEDLNEESNEETDDIVEPTPKTDEEKIDLYFANPEYIETGDEDLEHFVVEEKVLEYGDISIEEAIVKELMRAPNDSSMTTGIPSTTKLLGVEVADGTAFVNFSQEGLFGSSLQEYLTIHQITKSLLELDNIDKVQFLIDGEKSETLMGHYEILHPFEE
ncbi:MAG: hypothetical protein GX320_05445 [Tissierellia bacterium]|nr:hypothetical protein [Tissierellia bacterium]